MMDSRPGLNPQRLVRLMREAIERCRLDLSGATVFTEAASGAYVVTPVLAAMAGARHVYALTRTSRYGSVEEITATTMTLAKLAGVERQIQIHTEKQPELVALADIVTNSGHVRPINAEMIAWMKPTAVIPLMYEEWELRPQDVDLDACRQKDIWFAGTDERDPSVDVFSFLGGMAVKLLMDAGVAVHGDRVLLLCDNAFLPFLERGLRGAGASVVTDARPVAGSFDAVLVALQPKPAPVVSADDVHFVATRCPGAVLAQFWGDVDREACRRVGLAVWPETAPLPGHMGILPSAIGPEPIVRLQAGGLKVGERLWRKRRTEV